MGFGWACRAHFFPPSWWDHSTKISTFSLDEFNCLPFFFFFFGPSVGLVTSVQMDRGVTEVDADRLTFVVILLFSYGNQEEWRVKFKD